MRDTISFNNWYIFITQASLEPAQGERADHSAPQAAPKTAHTPEKSACSYMRSAVVAVISAPCLCFIICVAEGRQRSLSHQHLARFI